MRDGVMADKVNSLAMWLTRSLGVNLHPTSLPGGRLGAEAYAFVDWLAAAGARFWQVLPLNPPDGWGSPYASASAFAAWPGLLADPDAAVEPSELRRFEAENAYWVGDWSAFAGPGALAEQVRFQREWSALRAYAAERGVRLIGDVPIYVAEGSCDHAAHPDLFLPDDFVAGAPPDPLNDIGQKWGNPLYDWEALRREGYRWWTERMRRTLGLVDVFRIDHFRGFAGYWVVPAEAETARDGHWEPGPGAALFRAAESELGALPVIAEDLGVITPDVHELRDELGFPGMVVLLWAFGGPDDNPHRLENHRVHQVVYSSTHDTDTLRGSFPDSPTWELLEVALSSRAALAMVPVQDVLELGSEARMNRPGELGGGNWAWRLEPGELGPEQAARLRAAGEAAGRV
jgi:4-alpha-glucanotransferase